MLSVGRSGLVGAVCADLVCARQQCCRYVYGSATSRHQLCSFRFIIRLATVLNDDSNKMVRLRDVQGRVYNFKSKSECLGLGMFTLDVIDIVRSYMVLVLDVVLGKLDHIKVMTVGA